MLRNLCTLLQLVPDLLNSAVMLLILTIHWQIPEQGTPNEQRGLDLGRNRHKTTEHHPEEARFEWNVQYFPHSFLLIITGSSPWMT